MLDSTVHTMVEVLDNLKNEIITTPEISKKDQLVGYYNRILEMIPANFKSSSAYFGPAWKDPHSLTLTLEQKVIEHQITYMLLTLEGYVHKIKTIMDPIASQDYVSTLKELVAKIPDIKCSGLYFDGKPLQQKINMLKEFADSLIVL